MNKINFDIFLTAPNPRGGAETEDYTMIMKPVYMRPSMTQHGYVVFDDMGKQIAKFPVKDEALYYMACCRTGTDFSELFLVELNGGKGVTKGRIREVRILAAKTYFNIERNPRDGYYEIHDKRDGRFVGCNRRLLNAVKKCERALGWAAERAALGKSN